MLKLDSHVFDTRQHCHFLWVRVESKVGGLENLGQGFQLEGVALGGEGLCHQKGHQKQQLQG